MEIPPHLKKCITFWNQYFKERRVNNDKMIGRYIACIKIDLYKVT